MKLLPTILITLILSVLTSSESQADIKCAKDGYSFSDHNDVYECTDVLYTDWEITWDNGGLVNWGHDTTCHGAPIEPPFTDFFVAQQDALDTIEHHLTFVDDTECTHFDVVMCPGGLSVDTDTDWWNPPGDVNCQNRNFCERRTQELKYSQQINNQCVVSRNQVTYTKRRDRYCPSGYKLKNATQSDPTEFCFVPKGNTCPLGNPVSIFNAMKIMEEKDYQSAAQDGIYFSRRYNLNGFYPIQGLHDGPPELWFHNYSMQVFHQVNINNDDTAIVLRPDGTREYFWNDGTGFIGTSDSQSNLQLITGAKGAIEGWQYISSDDRIEQFNSQGLLTEIIHTSGIKHQVSQLNGKVSQVTDSYGRTLDFSYDSNQRLITVTANQDLTLNYGYAANGLISQVTYPDLTASPLDNPSKTYHYENSSFPLALTGITDELGNRYATYEYHDSGRVSRTMHHASDTLSVNEYTFNDRSSPGDYQITDPYGTAKTYLVSRTGSGIYKLGGTNLPCEFCGNKKSYNYDSDGNLQLARDFNNVISLHEHNVRNLETKRTEAYGSPAKTVTEIDWHPNFRKPTEKRIFNSSNQLMKVTQYTYDSDGRLLTETATDPTSQVSQTTTRTYCTASLVVQNICPIEGLLMSIDGPRIDVDDTTHFSYHMTTTSAHTMGDLFQVTNPLGHTTEYLSYDTHGRLLSSQDPNGVISSYTYHPRGWLESSTTAGLTTTYQYDHHGQLLQITKADGSYVGYEYDDAHRNTAVYDAQNNRIEYTLNNAGEVTSEQFYDVNGVIQFAESKTYDELGRLKTLVDGVNQTTTFVYDLNGNVIGSTDPGLAFTSHEYDAKNRLIKTTDAMNEDITYEYDVFDQITAVTDQRNLTTSYLRDALGRMKQLNSPDTGITLYDYDEAGNTITITDSAGVVTNRSYDALNRLTSTTYPDSTLNADFTYDSGLYAIGKLTAIGNQAENTSYQYNELGHITSEIHDFNDGLTFQITYSHDQFGRLSSTTYPSGYVVNQGYDYRGRVNNMSLGQAALLSNIQYQGFGPMTQMTLGNQLIIQKNHDQAHRLTEINHGGLEVWSYQYDSSGNLERIDDALHEVTLQHFSYDELNRLTHATGSYGSREYEYDAVGNRLSMQDPFNGLLQTYVYDDNSNRLVDWSGQSVSYTDTGHISSIGINQQYEYNLLGRLSGVPNGSRTYATFEYNPRGEKVKVSQSGSRNNDPDQLYIYSHAGDLMTTLKKNQKGELVIDEEFIYLNKKPVAMVGSSLYYFHNDHLGTPIFMTDKTPIIDWSADYTPFGNVFNVQGNAENMWRFPGQYEDENTGLYYNYFRDYHPELGRYIQSDPIGIEGGINTYAYANNNSINNIDPLGLQARAAPRPRPKPKPKPRFWRDPNFWEGAGDFLDNPVCKLSPASCVEETVCLKVFCESDDPICRIDSPPGYEPPKDYMVSMDSPTFRNPRCKCVKTFKTWVQIY